MEPQKSSFSIFLVLKGLNKVKKFRNHSKPPKLVSKSLFKKFQQIPNIVLLFYWTFSPLAPCALLGASQYQPTFGQQ